MEVKNNKILGLFFLAEFLAQFIFSLFLFNVEKKGRKTKNARTLAKKNRSIIDWVTIAAFISN